jgi:hypothetical protein
MAKFLQILDEIHENQEAFNDITSITEFEGIAVIGMRFSHPVTLSWQFFRHGVEPGRKTRTCGSYSAR